MLNFQGLSSSEFHAVIGKITTSRLPFHKRHNKILVTNKLDMGCLGYLGIISSAAPHNSFLYPHMVGNVLMSSLSRLHTGDIVAMNKYGEINMLWEAESPHNVLFLTEACNCRCKMCPQPPKPHNSEHYETALTILDLLKGEKCEAIGITGGEPTLYQNQFLHVLRRCIDEHSESNIDVLTNAALFADETYVREVAALTPRNVVFCVSLHSDIDTIHDEIVGRKGSYTETQLGIYNLAKYNITLEIRFVINKLNHTRIFEFAEHMYRYFPFCCNYAFMGLEMCGLAEENMMDVYIPPDEYKTELHKAILSLNKKGLPGSIYNIPLCFCDADVHTFARQSISSWKNFFPSACDSCSAKECCCGFFSTSKDSTVPKVIPL